MRHIEKPKRLLDSVTADVAVLTRLFWAVREIERAKVLEKNITTYGKALVEYSP
jgi:hypothetical protein